MTAAEGDLEALARLAFTLADASPRRVFVAALNARDARWNLASTLRRLGLARAIVVVDLAPTRPTLRVLAVNGDEHVLALQRHQPGALLPAILQDVVQESAAFSPKALLVLGVESFLEARLPPGMGDPYAGLNQSREALAELGVVVTLVVPHFCLPRLRNRAGDLWSWVGAAYALDDPADPVDAAWAPPTFLCPARRLVSGGDHWALIRLGFRLRQARGVEAPAVGFWAPWRPEHAVDVARLLLDAGRSAAALAMLASIDAPFAEPRSGEESLRGALVESHLQEGNFDDVLSLSRAPPELLQEVSAGRASPEAVDIVRASIVAARALGHLDAAQETLDGLARVWGRRAPWDALLALDGASLALARNAPWRALRALEPLSARRDEVGPRVAATCEGIRAAASAVLGRRAEAEEALRRSREIAPMLRPLERWRRAADAALTRDPAGAPTSPLPPAMVPSTTLDVRDRSFALKMLLELLNELDSRDGESVWRVRDRATQRVFSLRYVHADILAREGAAAQFESELRRLREIHHPNLAPLYDGGVWNVSGRLTPCQVIEWVDGVDLWRLLAEHDALPLQRVVEAVVPVLGAVEALHRGGFVHRHLRAASIVVRRAEPREGVLVETGVVQRLGDTVPGELGRSFAGGGALVDVVQYLSPEAVRSEAPTPAMDVWSIAIVLYECLAGRAPWKAGGSREIQAQILSGPIPPVHEVLRESGGADDQVEAAALVWPVLERALERDRPRRFLSVAAFEDALITALREAPEAVVPWFAAFEARRVHFTAHRAAINPAARPTPPSATPAVPDALVPCGGAWSADLPRHLLEHDTEVRWRRRAFDLWELREDSSRTRLYAVLRSPIPPDAWEAVSGRALHRLRERYGAMPRRVRRRVVDAAMSVEEVCAALDGDPVMAPPA